MKRAVNALQNFGKSLYGPVLILPIVGLFIAFGNVLGNGNLAEYLPFLGHPLIQSVGQLIAKSAVSVLVNLALVFAVGIPIGLVYTDIKVVSFNMKKTLKLSTSSDRPT